MSAIGSLKEGSLTKSSHDRFKKWKVRYFLLQENALHHFSTTKKNIKLKGVIDLRDIKTIEVLGEEKRKRIKIEENEQYAFQLTTPKRVVTLICASEDELLSWIESIEILRALESSTWRNKPKEHEKFWSPVDDYKHTLIKLADELAVESRRVSSIYKDIINSSEEKEDIIASRDSFCDLIFQFLGLVLKKMDSPLDIKMQKSLSYLYSQLLVYTNGEEINQYLDEQQPQYAGILKTFHSLSEVANKIVVTPAPSSKNEIIEAVSEIAASVERLCECQHDEITFMSSDLQSITNTTLHRIKEAIGGIEDSEKQITIYNIATSIPSAVDCIRKDVTNRSHFANLPNNANKDKEKFDYLMTELINIAGDLSSFNITMKVDEPTSSPPILRNDMKIMRKKNLHLFSRESSFIPTSP